MCIAFGEDVGASLQRVDISSGCMTSSSKRIRNEWMLIAARLGQWRYRPLLGWSNVLLSLGRLRITCALHCSLLSSILQSRTDDKTRSIATSLLRDRRINIARFLSSDGTWLSPEHLETAVQAPGYGQGGFRVQSGPSHSLSPLGGYIVSQERP